MEAWTGPSPAPRYDQALAANGAVATSSSNYGSAYGPSCVTDGDRKSLYWGNGGGWNDAAPSNTFPDWVQIDFAGSKTINEIDVYTLQDSYAASVEPTEAMTMRHWRAITSPRDMTREYHMTTLTASSLGWICRLVKHPLWTLVFFSLYNAPLC